ncbi:MAG: hypothetical protein FWG68_06420 [Defluviitaleaceae bacterium]|nr:hypothetical protein [Defluviitaleaceae bacterium]
MNFEVIAMESVCGDSPRTTNVVCTNSCLADWLERQRERGRRTTNITCPGAPNTPKMFNAVCVASCWATGARVFNGICR